jgi:hypothetical protein
MPSRRHFISAAAAAAAAGLSGIGDSTPAEAAAPKGPSSAALAQANALREAMPGAHLTDDLVEKIAGDIDGYASTAADFRKTRLHNWDEPDFVFTAGPKATQR